MPYLCLEYKTLEAAVHCIAEGLEERDEYDKEVLQITHRGMRVRYVRTLAKASSGISLKVEHSGRVMMTLESSPRPPTNTNIIS